MATLTNQTKTQQRYATDYWLAERVGTERLSTVAKHDPEAREGLIRELLFWYEHDGFNAFVHQEGPNCPENFTSTIPNWVLDEFYSAMQSA